MQPNSPSFQDAARRGLLPMSQQVGHETLRAHRETYSGSAADAGLVPHRANWRVLRDVFVAETDEEARWLVLKGGGRAGLARAFSCRRSRPSVPGAPRPTRWARSSSTPA